MRQATRAIIMHDNKLLVMHRNKFGKEYYTLIGGGVDYGETIEQSLIREIQEETSLHVTEYRKVFIEDAGRMYGVQHVFLCTYPAGGDVKMPESSPEALINQAGKNLYTPMWLPLSKLVDSAFVSEALKQAILDGIKNGFPQTPRHIDKSAVH